MIAIMLAYYGLIMAMDESVETLYNVPSQLQTHFLNLMYLLSPILRNKRVLEDTSIKAIIIAYYCLIMAMDEAVETLQCSLATSNAVSQFDVSPFPKY